MRHGYIRCRRSEQPSNTFDLFRTSETYYQSSDIHRVSRTVYLVSSLLWTEPGALRRANCVVPAVSSDAMIRAELNAGSREYAELLVARMEDRSVSSYFLNSWFTEPDKSFSFPSPFSDNTQPQSPKRSELSSTNPTKTYTSTIVGMSSLVQPCQRLQRSPR